METVSDGPKCMSKSFDVFKTFAKLLFKELSKLFTFEAPARWKQLVTARCAVTGPHSVISDSANQKPDLITADQSEACRIASLASQYRNVTQQLSRSRAG